MQDNFPEFIIVHHTGGTDADPLADTSHHTFEIVKEWHLHKGWEDIGYHYFIEKDGKLTAGRKETYHGAHTVGYNEKSIGICLAGNFDQTMPTEAQEQALTSLMKDIRTRYKIPIEKILPHRHFANKTCYGRRLADDWAQKLLGQKDYFPEIKAEDEKLLTLIDEAIKAHAGSI